MEQLGSTQHVPARAWAGAASANAAMYCQHACVCTTEHITAQGQLPLQQPTNCPVSTLAGAYCCNLSSLTGQTRLAHPALSVVTSLLEALHASSLHVISPPDVLPMSQHLHKALNAKTLNAHHGHVIQALLDQTSITRVHTVSEPPYCSLLLNAFYS